VWPVIPIPTHGQAVRCVYDTTVTDMDYDEDFEDVDVAVEVRPLY
jgi:hypothetical protein